MERRRSILGMLAIPLLILLVILLSSAVFTVDERQKALVLRLGRVVAVKTEPGLGFKLPFVDSVAYYDDRILGLQTNPLEVTPLDDRRLVVDAFARWRITDLVRFRRAVGAGGIDTARNRLGPIVNDKIREVLGRVPSTMVLSEDRTPLMNQIRDLARAQAADFGIDVVDVRLTRTDLPTQNLESTYARMRAEREREAADERARGGEAARRVRATADRTVVELTSSARRDSEIIRGEADARRNEVFASAFGRDPEFFAFTRSLTAYQRALQGSNSQLIIPPDGEFFTYLRSDGAELATPQPTSDGAAMSPDAGASPDASATSADEGVGGELFRPLSPEMPMTSPVPEAPVGEDSPDASAVRDTLPEVGAVPDAVLPEDPAETVDQFSVEVIDPNT